MKPNSSIPSCLSATTSPSTLQRGSLQDRVLDKRIDNTVRGRQGWQHRTWRTIETHYGRAPYFAHYADELCDVYSRTWSSLVAGKGVFTWTMNP